VRIENDRNFDGRVDLVQEYSGRLLVREVHDDDFDSKPESIERFRRGKLRLWNETRRSVGTSILSSITMIRGS